MICPCKGCDRAGCGAYHDQCDAYRSWRGELDEVNRRKASDQDCRQLSHDHEMKYRKNLKKGRK